MRVGWCKVCKKEINFLRNEEIHTLVRGRGMCRKPKIFSKNPKILLVNMKKYVIIGVDFNVIAVAYFIIFFNLLDYTLIFSNHCQCIPGVRDEVGPRDQKYQGIPQQPGFEFSGPRLLHHHYLF